MHEETINSKADTAIGKYKGKKYCVAALIAVTITTVASTCTKRVNCDQFRKRRVGATSFSDLLNTANKCLSPDEVSALKAAHDKYERVNLGDLLDVMTVEEAIKGESNEQGNNVDELLAEALTSSPAQPSQSGAQQQLSKKAGPWVIQHAVLFVYKENTDANGGYYNVPDATGFIVSVPDQAHTKLLRYFITARHVLDPTWAHCNHASDENNKVVIRFNKAGGGVAYETIPLVENGNKQYVTLSDETVDLSAVLLTPTLVPNLPKYRFFDIPFRVISTTSESDDISIKQEVMTAGLLPDFAGTKENNPFLLTGILSSKPHEVVGVPCSLTEARDLHLWFIGATIPAGVSGAPVFTLMDRGAGAHRSPVLVGVQSMSFENKGIAGITPAGYLVRLIRTASSAFHVDLYRGPAHQ